MFGLRVLLAESGALVKQFVRPRSLALWIVAAVIWPLAYVALLGNAGATPLYLALSLAANPIGPILYALAGATMAAVQGRELSAVWPAAPTIRAGGSTFVLAGAALAAGLTTLGSCLWNVSAGFWAPPGFAISSVASGLGVLFTTYGFWLAVGFAIGGRIREPWRTIIAVLAPVSVVVAATMVDHITSSPLLQFVSVSPSASGFLDSVDAFGFGPLASLHNLVVWASLALAVLGLALAALSAYGRQAAAGMIAAASVVAVVCLGTGVSAMAGSVFTTRDPASAYLRGPYSPVQVAREHVAVSVAGAPDLRATDQLTLVAARSLTSLRVFLVPSLHVSRILVGGNPARWSRPGMNGWLTVYLAEPLAPGRATVVTISYAGNPTLFVPLKVNAPNLTTFVSAQGWQLPAGTWYPLIGRPGERVRWEVSLEAPADYLTVTPYGTVSGSTRAGRPLTGDGVSLGMVGGHLAAIGQVGGVSVYAAADQVRLARAAMRGTLGGEAGAGLNHTAACLADSLVPAPKGRVVWVRTTATPQWVSGLESVVAPDDLPWQARQTFGAAGGNPGMGVGLGPAYTYQAEFGESFPETVIGLWLSGGRSSSVPLTGAAGQLVGGLVYACAHNYGNGTELTALTPKIGSLTRPGLRFVTQRAYAANRRGQLTLGILGRLVRTARSRYGVTKG